MLLCQILWKQKEWKKILYFGEKSIKSPILRMKNILYFHQKWSISPILSKIPFSYISDFGRYHPWTTIYTTFRKRESIVKFYFPLHQDEHWYDITRDILMGTILTTSILTLRNCFYFPAAALPAGVRSQTGWPGLDQPQYSWKIPSSCWFHTSNWKRDVPKSKPISEKGIK